MPPYGTYPNPAYYGGYGSAGYYGPYSAGAPLYSGAMQGAGPVAGAVAGAPPLNAPDYLPPNPQW